MLCCNVFDNSEILKKVEIYGKIISIKSGKEKFQILETFTDCLIISNFIIMYNYLTF